MNHKTVQLRVGHFEAAIDEKIASLIEQIWQADIATTNSCEEIQPGIAWVEFASAQDCARFLEIVAEYEVASDYSSLYDRMCCRGYDPSTPGKHWRYSIEPFDRALTEWMVDDKGTFDDSHSGTPSFDFYISVRFPITDLTVVVERLARFNGHVRSHRLHPDYDHEDIIRQLSVPLGQAADTAAGTLCANSATISGSS